MPSRRHPSARASDRLIFIAELTARDADSAEHAAHALDEYLETLLGAGLLAFRIGRDLESAARIVLLEEWTSTDAHDAHATKPTFATLQATLAPLLAGAPRTANYEIVAAGFSDDDE